MPIKLKKGLVTFFFALTALSSAYASSGVGTATVVPANATGGSVLTATVTYTVPAGGIAVGGKVEVVLPLGWYPYPQTTDSLMDGYTTIATTASASLTLTVLTSSPVAVARVVSGSVPPATQLAFLFNRIHPTCPMPGQTQTAWTVKSAMASTDTLSEIASQPIHNFVGGSAQWISYSQWDQVMVAANQPSSALVLQAWDNCGKPAALDSELTVNLSGLARDMNTYMDATDTGAQFAATSGFAAAITSATIPALSNSATFYYRTSTVGSNLWIRGDYLNPQGGWPQQLWRSVTSLAAAPSLGSPSVDSGAAVPGQKTLTLSPDGSGTNNGVYIRFSPSDSQLMWRVQISSNGFQTNVFERSGNGDPNSTLYWDGRDYMYSNRIVPNGTYTVRIEIPGLIIDTSLSITVQTSQISGTVTVGGTPVSGANVYAQGANTPGYSFTTTDGNGNYVLPGLRAGYQYNLYANYMTAAQALVAGQLNNIAAPATGQNFALSTPAIFRINAVASSSRSVSSYGYLNIHPADYTRNYSGNVRLLAGTMTSDNGDSFSPSSWTLVAVEPGTYVIRLNIDGFGADEVTQTVSTGQTADVILPLTTKASLYGRVQFPAALTESAWVSVDGTKQGNSYSTVWGGAYLEAGQSSGIFSIFGVDTGVYAFRARTSGYASAVLNNVTVPSTGIGNPATGGLDFPEFSQGGHITGTLAINGDTSEWSSLNVWLSAYSQALGQNEFTQVSLTTTTTTTSATYFIRGLADGAYVVYPPYLQGFQPPSWGPQSVTVSGGVGNLNLTLTRNSAALAGSVTLPAGQTDYSNVHLSLNGPQSQEVDLTSGPSYTVSHLSPGFYSLTATYRTTGAQIRTNFPVANGQTVTQNLNLSAATRRISGTISIQSAFSVRGSSGSLVSINTIADLLSNATNQTLYIGGYSGTSVVSTSTARVEAFPKTFYSYNENNRTGFSNYFSVGGYNYGVIDSSGNYSIPGLSAGLWEVNVYPYIDGGLTANVATLKRVLTVSNSDVSGIDFPLSSGYSVAGTISLPSGVTDARPFKVQVLSTRGDLIQSTQINVGVAGTPASSAAYEITSLPSGNYTLLVQDYDTYDMNLMQNVVKYVSRPVPFTIASANKAGVDVTLGRAASLIGRIGIEGSNTDGTPNITVITSSNTNLLPSNFSIYTRTDPWVPGGEGNALYGNNGKIAFDSNNQFRVNGLVPGTYNVYFKQDSYSLSVQGAGSMNLAAYTKGSVVVAEGQTVDLGTISLKQGLSLSGTVTDQSGTALGNITVRAEPSTDQHGDNNTETYTDAAGRFTLTGLDPSKRIYNIIAAPRPYPSEQKTPFSYGAVVKKAVDVTLIPSPALAFVLPPATASFAGRVRTVDDGAFSYPDGDKEMGFPVAAVYLHLQGAAEDDNPMGWSNATGLDGNFSIPNIVAGTYDITVMSLGYRPLKLTGVILSRGVARDLGTLTLQKGPQLTVTLAKPDGTSVNTNDIRMAVAVTPDMSSLIFSQIDSDANTGDIRFIKFGGFELSPKTYNILFFDNQDNMSSPVDGRGIVFSANTDVLSKAITLQPSAPFAYAHVKKSGNAFSITYYLSRPLRSRGDDQDATQWMNLLSGAGTLSGHSLSGDRREFTVLYTPAPREQNARIRFRANSVDIDPSTGVEYLLSKTITLLLGHKSMVESNINSALGGSLSLVTDDDPSTIAIPSNALRTSTGAAVDSGTSYAFSFTATDDETSLSSSGRAGMRSAALGSLMARGSGAFVSEAYAAMGAARASAAINPLSSFYSVLLPAGLSHTLNQTAYLTLSYDSSADPNLINIYYFDGTRYLLESNQRSVDLVNRTITVGVSHFSTFVVLENSAPIVVVDGDSASGGEIEVFNFPNPFDLQTKIKTLTHGGTTTSLSTDGTIIRYKFPASKAGSASIDIYDVAGQKVRSISLGAPTADVYHYVAWDGRNDAGNKVASGVYIGILKVGGEKKFWKMAVIK
ncbi:MAG: carboxypeptidase regulatory-like domain-containing protein [Elusimicrobiota bacterium]|jgi:hypothetical protein